MNRLLGHRYSHETISAMTEEVLQAVEAFRRRPLPEEMAFVYLDGLYLKLLREGEGVVREVVYVALGVTPSGERRVLGYWLLPAESALGWEGVLGELWQRGLRRVLLFITDGLPGLPEAIRRVYPQAEWQRCVVHGVRWSLGQVRARDRTLLAEDLRRVYGAESRAEALEALEALREAWGSRYPGVVALWAGDSGTFLRFYGYPKVLWPYLRSTNLMERFIREIRRGTKVRDHKFPSEEAVYKLLYLGHGRQPVSWVGEARREVGGAKAQGVLGGEGDAGKDASGAVCPPYTNAYTYFLTRPYLGVHARLVFPDHRDEAAVLDLMRRFSSATRFAYNRLLEGQDRKELKREDGPLCALFGLNTRYADGAIEKAQATLDSARELGQDPRKVVFGGRKLFEQLKRKHFSGKARERLRREWKEKRQGLLYSRGDATKKGNANLRLEPQGDALWLRVNLGNGAHVQALVKTAHPQLKALLQRAYASLPYNVTLRLEDGKVYAHFTWSEEVPPPVHTKENGVLGIDVNGDPYHLALAVVSPDGNLKRHLTLSLEEVDRAPNRGTKELLLWKVAHQVVALAEEHGVAIATEKLKYLRKSRRGDGSGRHFRCKQHRFAYRSLLAKVHSLARKRGVEVLEVDPKDTSNIGMLKYAPLLHLSKDVAAAYVIGRRALGFEEKLPKGYEALLKDDAFLAHVQGFYGSRLQELQKLKEAEKNPHLRRRLSRDMGKAKAALTLVSSLQGSPGSRKGVTKGRNPSGAHPWRVLRVGLCKIGPTGLTLPLLGLEVPRDLSPLKPILHGSWEGWKVGSGPHPGGGPECANVHFY